MSSMSPPAAASSPIYYSLSFQLVVGLILGIVVGYVWPTYSAEMNALATGFVKLIKGTSKNPLSVTISPY